VDVQFLQRLRGLDEAIAAQVRAERCPHCGGRLDRADYPRKPRGGALAPGAEVWCRRLSLCCSQEGCRRRSTPPSVRFLGRRVYAEVVVVLASLAALVTERASTMREATGVPARTVRRWSGWWRTAFVASALWLECRARMVPPPAEEQLPASLLARFTRSTALVDLARLLAPATTTSVPDGSRFVRLSM
jgi:hypothetical protein